MVGTVQGRQGELWENITFVSYRPRWLFINLAINISSSKSQFLDAAPHSFPSKLHFLDAIPLSSLSILVMLCYKSATGRNFDFKGLVLKFEKESKEEHVQEANKERQEV